MKTDEEFRDIRDIGRRIGYELTKKQCWRIGKDVAKDWKRAYGKQPVKDLRPKPTGKGKYCLALYPSPWWPLIERRIRWEIPPPITQGELRL